MPFLNETMEQFDAFYFKSDKTSGRQTNAIKGKRKFLTIDTENVAPTTSGKTSGKYVMIPMSRKRGELLTSPGHQQPWYWWCKRGLSFDSTRKNLNRLYHLTHWGRDKMAVIFQTTFSNAFSWKKDCCILIKISLKGPQLTLFQHCFRQWLGAGQATSLYLNQSGWLSLMTHICVARSQWVKPGEMIVQIHQVLCMYVYFF